MRGQRKVGIYSDSGSTVGPWDYAVDIWDYANIDTLAMDIARCNVTGLFRCINGNCVNINATCNGLDDCLDGSDETNAHAQCDEGPKKLGALEVAAIVIGCIVGTVILCCLLGTIIDCFMHVYKYWCSCLHKAYHCPSEMVALRTPNGGPNEPTVLVVRAIPPSYSTIIVSCEAASRLTARSRENTGSNHVTLVAADDMNSTPTQEMSMQTITTTHSLQSPPQSPEHQILIKLADNNHNKKEISTQTSSPFFSRSAGSCTRPETVRLSDVQQPSAPLAQSPTSSISSSSPMLEGATLPPSYSSIFRNDYITYASDTTLQTSGGFLAPPR